MIVLCKELGLEAQRIAARAGGFILCEGVDPLVGRFREECAAERGNVRDASAFPSGQFSEPRDPVCP